MSISAIMLRKGAFEESLQAQQKSVTLAEKLVAAEPDNMAYRKHLAEGYRILGQALYSGGKSRSVEAQWAALEKFKQALAIHEALSTANPGDARFQEEIASDCAYVSYALSAIARLSGDTSKYQAARENLKRCSEIYQRIAAIEPFNNRAQRNAAISLGDIALAEISLSTMRPRPAPPRSVR